MRALRPPVALAGRLVRSSSTSAQRPCLLVDAFGVLLTLSEPLEAVYLRVASSHGVQGLTSEGVKREWRKAWSAPRPEGQLRYEGDGSHFWRRVVAAATGCHDAALFQELFTHYSKPEAWRVADGAHDALARLRAGHVRLGLVSNFDNRLRPLLHDLELAPLFDSLIVSAEVGFEKPDRRIYEAAAHALGVSLRDCHMVGDDEECDVQGALQAGCAGAWLYGRDVASFCELADRVLQ